MKFFVLLLSSAALIILAVSGTEGKSPPVYKGVSGNMTLALVSSEVEFPVSYTTKANKTKTQTIKIGKSYNTTAVLLDNNRTVEMKVTFSGKDKKKNGTGIWTLRFEKTSGANTSNFTTASLFLNNVTAFDFEKKATIAGENLTAVWNVGEPLTGSDKFWQCESKIERRTDVEGGVEANMSMTHSRIQAFAFSASDFLSKHEECKADKPEPAPEEGMWSVNETDTNTSCILLKSGIVLRFHYTTSSTNSTKDSGKITVPKEARVGSGSSCLKTVENGSMELQEMILSFKKSWSLTLGFADNENLTGVKNGEYWVLYHVKLQADLSDTKDFPDAQPKVQTFENVVNLTTGEKGLRGLMAMKSHSWVCKHGYNESVSPSFNVDFADVHIQAFANATDFLRADLCGADQKTSNLIPIVVGACLAGLVVVVLVAYLIGRARARRATGYQSV